MQTKEIKKVFTEDGKEKEYVATLKRFSYKDMNELEDASTEIVFTGTEKEGKAVLRQGALKNAMLNLGVVKGNFNTENIPPEVGEWLKDELDAFNERTEAKKESSKKTSEPKKEN